jgi:phosphatidate cytidylyltransferase
MSGNRILSAIIVIPAVYFFILWGGFAFYALITGIALAGLIEFYNMCSSNNLPSSKWWGGFISVLLISNSYLITAAKKINLNTDLSPLILTLLILGLMMILLLKKDLKSAVLDLAITVTGVFYVSWMINHAILLREIKPYGFQLTMSVLIAVWFSDTGAYFSGLKLGKKRKLHIASPNKSRAGAVGSVLLGILGMILSRYIFDLYFISNTETLILGGMIGILAVIGDLAESMIKRNLGQKDSGKFLPGHGGVLDRIDSILFAVPFAYYYIRLIIIR